MPIHMKTFFNTVIFSAIVTVITFVDGLSARLLSGQGRLAGIAADADPAAPHSALGVGSAARLRLVHHPDLNGPLNAIARRARAAGPADPLAERRFTPYDAIIIGLVYTYVLFMLFPIYNSIQSLDRNQIEAAEDLGSPWWRTHWRVILPHAKPGIASGCVMVFMLSAGSLLVPTVLPSTRSNWFTQTIQVLMLESQDWNAGAAYSFLYILLCTVFVTLVMWLFKVKLSDIAK